MNDVYIAAAVRTAVGKAPRGTLATTRPDDLAATAIRGALDRVPALDAGEIEDVILGCAMPEAEQGTNVARIASLRAGLPVEVSAMTINRFCSSGLQAIALAAGSIRSGRARRWHRIDEHDPGNREQIQRQSLADREPRGRLSVDGAHG